MFFNFFDSVLSRRCICLWPVRGTDGLGVWSRSASVTMQQTEAGNTLATAVVAAIVVLPGPQDTLAPALY